MEWLNLAMVEHGEEEGRERRNLPRDDGEAEEWVRCRGESARFRRAWAHGGSRVLIGGRSHHALDLGQRFALANA